MSPHLQYKSDAYLSPPPVQIGRISLPAPPSGTNRTRISQVLRARRHDKAWEFVALPEWRDAVLAPSAFDQRV